MSMIFNKFYKYSRNYYYYNFNKKTNKNN